MLKKYLLSIVILAGILFSPFFSFAQTANLQAGSTGASVLNLQNVLKSDPSIYPQGLVTGFYGPATQAAIKKLQAKYGLPQTGIVDSATLAIIFPNNVQLKVISPNGGESWDKLASHAITWQVTVGPITYNGLQLAPSTSSSPSAIARPTIMPFYNNASIDLIRDSDSSFRYHIGNANLFDTQFNFQIPSSIQNGSDYRAQVTVGGQVPCLMQQGIACPMYYPQYSNLDASDNTFSITGSSGNSGLKLKLQAIIYQLQQEINNLQNQINSLRDLLNSL